MINLKKIPSIDEILIQEEIQQLISRYKRDFVVETARMIVAEFREELRLVTEEIEKKTIFTTIVDKIKEKAESSNAGTLQRVINGTGVVLHTNLGRAPLAERAVKHMQDIGRSYNNLEMDLNKGERGSRYYHVEELLIKLTGAEAALVVNNNAAAVMLGLTTLAEQREVIVSRGQLVEIGGAFRIPEVMKQSGAKLREVGTTNKTYVSDYAQAINEDTALLFSAHTSNYQIIGFTSEVSMEELVSLGKDKGLPVFMDLGSGILTALDDGGLGGEPTVQECVKAGADIITFSGDKMLGGPQAGIIVGKREYIDRMKKNQLLRALRVDKLILAALEGTLLEYLSGHPRQSVPIIQMLSYSREQLEDKAEHLLRLLEARLEEGINQYTIRLVTLEDMVGGGAYPNHKMPGAGVEIEFGKISLDKAARELRLRNPALVARKQDNKMLISVRTLLPGDEQEIIEMIASLGEKQSPV
ncbi:l-seryl-trna(sec) selenium transferase [hydrocarbon metagenome]|uniref:L-seryl-trna(Sec) selenium transferase n=1 Tax=hydrocarbon metagenome TaxID=938273 RepID=A0A0W8E6V2_9ZZZZ